MKGKLDTWAEEFEELGFQKGCAQGKAEGVAEGVAQGVAQGKAEGQVIALRGALKSLLRVRFGDIPEPAAQRIDRATQAELEGWIERSIDSPSLPALFGDDAAPA